MTQLSITRNFVVALIAIALLAGLDYVLIVEQIRMAESNGHILNVSSRLQLLSQRAVYLATIINSDNAEAVRNTAAEDLVIVVDELEKTHLSIIPSVGRNGPAAGASEDMHVIYFEPPLLLDQRTRDYVTTLRSMLDTPSPERALNNIHFENLKVTAASLLSAQQAVTAHFQSEGRNRLNLIRTFDNVTRFFFLACLAATGYFIILPMIRQLNRDVEAQFKSLSEASPIGIFLNDSSGNCTYTNPRWQQITGVDYDASLGAGWTEMIHPEDKERVFSEWESEVDSGREFSSEFRINTPGGNLRWAHSRAAPIESVSDAGAKTVTGYVGTTEDITQRKQTQDELRRSRERFDLAIRGTDDGIWDWDLRTNESYYSPRYEALLGYEKSTFGRDYRSFESLIHPEDKARVKTAIERHLETHEPYKLEYRLQTKHNDFLWFSAGGQAEWDETGKAIRMAGSIRDIASQRQLQHDLRLTQASIDKATEAIFWSRRDGSVCYVNDAACKSLGYNRDELLSMRVFDFDQKLTQDRLQSVWDLQKDGGSNKLESTHRRKDGTTFPIEIVTSAIDFEGEEYQMSFAIDITERHRNELELRRYTDEVVRARADIEIHANELQKRTDALARSNKELEQFAYISSHDLQEPLRKIQSFGDRLNRKYGDVLGEQGQDYLERMRASASRMQTLIQDLLGYSRVSREQSAFSPVDLAGIVDNAIADLETRIEDENGRVEYSDLPTIDGDSTQLRQLFQNLIGNGLKFHAAGQAPIVSISSQKLSPSVEDSITPERYEFKITDNGIGFDEKYIDKIFAPFQRLHGRSEFDGTGIGLAVCQKIVERHNGEITVTSAPGCGSTFIVTLPAAQFQPAVAA